MNPTLEIFSQGEEIVTGQTVDTNAAWLSEQAMQLGFTLTRHTSVGDKLEDLTQLLTEIAQRADCCLCTGGLGPTRDDLTAEAVALAFGLPLEFDEIAFEQISQYYRARKRPMPDVNRKQALLPHGSIRLDNAWGTAPGFALHAGRCWFVFMPGVPSEMRNMFQAHVKPLLAGRFTLHPSRLVTIKTLGIGESDIQQLIGDIEIPGPVQLGFRAGIDEVQIKLLFPADCSISKMVALTNSIAERLSPMLVFGIDGLTENVGSLASVVDKLMIEAGKSLAVIETASHGLLAAKCLGYSWFHGAVYAKSLTALARRLDATADSGDLSKSGQELANALWAQSKVDMVLVQLYEGSSEQFQNQVHSILINTTLVHHNIELETAHMSQQHTTLSGTATRKQNQAALFALNMLRCHLLDRK
ncbi:MAG: competence/damage-inducible protein A [Gammaproteobacteria bacterium]